ncbi:MAG: AMP-binding protein [Actinophytocola sp.]|nr:AMP-binding protein [Actinophytocola sp.]
MKAESASEVGPEWVDDVLLAGPDKNVPLHLSTGPIAQSVLRQLVAERREALAAAGLRQGGCVAPRLPPSLAYVANLLAVWRIGAQAVLIDHRLTQYELDQAVRRLGGQLPGVGRRTQGGPHRGRARADRGLRCSRRGRLVRQRDHRVRPAGGHRHRPGSRGGTGRASGRVQAPAHDARTGGVAPHHDGQARP